MDITKQVFNRKEFKKALGIGDTKFRELRRSGVIPNPDNPLPTLDGWYSPQEWHRATVLRTIYELNQLKTKAPK